MKVLCIWGDTRADVEAGYAAVAEFEDPPQRITWRLTAAFEQEGAVGDVCYAPGHPDIQEAYREVLGEDEIPVLTEALSDDDID